MFTRIPFGPASAPEVFHGSMSRMLEKCMNVECSMDDNLIHAETSAELESIPAQVIEAIKDSSLKLNKKKYMFNVQEITLFGTFSPRRD